MQCTRTSLISGSGGWARFHSFLSHYVRVLVQVSRSEALTAHVCDEGALVAPRLHLVVLKPTDPRYLAASANVAAMTPLDRRTWGFPVEYSSEDDGN